jgi:hypothetical protein
MMIEQFGTAALDDIDNEFGIVSSVFPRIGQAKSYSLQANLHMPNVIKHYDIQHSFVILCNEG